MPGHTKRSIDEVYDMLAAIEKRLSSIEESNNQLAKTMSTIISNLLLSAKEINHAHSRNNKEIGN